MAKKDYSIQLESIKTLLENGKIKKLGQLEELSPTYISKSIGLNYGRYIIKLHKPELFTLLELKKFATLINTDLRVIVEIILKEIR
jgi:hypothetical protein